MIDWTRVEELRNDLGREDFDEVVELFLFEMEDRFEQITESQSTCSAEDLHFLKGCAANVGFSDLHALCARAEATGEYSLAEIKANYRRSKDAFLSELNPAPGHIKTPESTSSSVMSR